MTHAHLGTVPADSGSDTLPADVLPEAAAMETMRDALKAATNRTRKAAHSAASPMLAAELGMLGEALDAAEGALFNALNVAQAHCNSTLALNAIRRVL